jgi:hypothetical protein
MTLLAEIRMGDNPSWIDDSIGIWIDDSIGIWKDGVIVDLNISDVNFYDTVFFENAVLGFDPPSYAMDTPHGGHLKCNSGSITIALSAFSALFWPPPKTISIIISHTETSYASKVQVFSGTGYISKVDYPESVTYSLYGLQRGGPMLKEAIDYDGRTIVLPRAFGSVTHAKCIRLPDIMAQIEGGTPPMYACYTGGYLIYDADFRVYDDGVDITSNIERYGLDGTGVYYDIEEWGPGVKGVAYFALTVTPTGTVTVSGNGRVGNGTSDDITDPIYLCDVFTWACNSYHLNLTQDFGDFTGYQVSVYVTTQVDLLTFLSQIAAANLFMFYIYQNSNAYGSTNGLVLINMRENLPALSTYAIDISTDAIQGSNYTYLAPMVQLTYRWAETIANDVLFVLEDIERSITVNTENICGEPAEVELYLTDPETIKARLSEIIDFHHKVRGSFRLPLSGTLPIPGQQLDVTDTRYSPAISGTFYVRDIQYDFINREIIVSGEGGF